MGLSSMLMTTSLWAAAIMATAKWKETPAIINSMLRSVSACLSSMCGCTSCRHADITVHAIWITAELLQAVNGALTHYWFPAKRSVVDYLQHNGRGVHLLFGEKLVEKTIQHMDKLDIKHLQVSDYIVYEGLKVITTLRSKTDPGKLGFFLKFLITAVSTISPPHSTIKLGEETVANW